MPVLLPFLFALSMGTPAQAAPASRPKTAVAPSTRLSVLRTLKVGGEGAWDYVTLDAEAGRLYVPRSTRVMVLDLEGKKIGEIPGTAGVHGVALAKDMDRGYTSNGRANTMTVFKLSTLEVIKEVKATGENPDAILYDPATKQVFSFNGRGKNVTVFNAETLEVTGTIPMGGKPEFSVSDGKGRVFVNVEDTHELLSINARTRIVDARWSLKPVEEAFRSRHGCGPSASLRRGRKQAHGCRGRHQRQACEDSAHRRGLRRRGLRCGNGLRVCLQRGRHSYSHYSGWEGPLHRREHHSHPPKELGPWPWMPRPTGSTCPPPSSVRRLESKPGQHSRPPMIPDSFPDSGGRRGALS